MLKRFMLLLLLGGALAALVVILRSGKMPEDGPDSPPTVQSSSKGDSKPSPSLRSASREAIEAASAASIAAPAETIEEPPTGEVKGVLFNAFGERIPRGLISFTRPGIRSRDVPSIHTDARGDFWVKNLLVGEWQVFYEGSSRDYGSATTHVGQVEIWEDRVTPLQIYLPGSSVLKGRFVLEGKGTALKLVLRDYWSNEVVARALAVNLDSQLQRQLEKGRPESEIPEKLYPGFFAMSGLKPGKYLLSVGMDFVDPEVVGKLLKFEVDLTAEELALPPREFTLADFGLVMNEK